MPTLRIAMLGSGSIAETHARAIALTPGAALVAVANHRLESASALAARHGVARVGDDWRAFCSAPDVDAVLIATPNSLHEPQAIAALAAGKHVLVEKPIATSAAGGRRMVAAAAAAGRCLMVGHMWRFHDAVVAMRERVAAGELGRVVRTHGYGVHAGWGPSGWFTDPQLAGGGALIDMGIHAIDTARFLLGDPLPVRVVGSLRAAYGSAGVDDDGLLLIDWEGGARSLVESGWNAPHLGGLEADTELYGSHGYARIWPVEQPEGYDHCPVDVYASQLAHFVERCADGRPPQASGEVGLVALEIAEAAYASSAEVAP